MNVNSGAFWACKRLNQRISRICNIYRLKTLGPRFFVLGNQKSGTSAIASLLGIMAGYKTAVDFSTKRIMAVKQVRKKELSVSSLLCDNVDRLGTAVILKEPHLTFLSQELKASYPRSKHVFVVREPAENIRSICDRLHIQEFQLDSSVSLFNFQHTYKFNPGWELVFKDETLYPESFKDLTLIELLAYRWKLAVQVYLSNVQNMILVRYEDFLNDKENTIGSLAERLGMPQRQSIRAHMNQQFQPKGARQCKLTARHHEIISEIAYRELESLRYGNL